jgi:processive 1,2-diacylglycerol beta-glucosyltransferase
MDGRAQTVEVSGSRAALKKDAGLRSKQDDALSVRRADSGAQRAGGEREESPVLILTISNGAGHVRTAEGLAAAIRKAQPDAPVLVADVADYMTPLARFTHVTAYLWIVKHAPAVWDRIDRYQKRQTHTSPEWFYRRTCRALFELARRVRPRALVATEVGCCEIAALIKRDLALDAPLVAVNNDPDADRAWVQPEVDLYCFATDECGDELIAHGALRERVRVWGASLAEGFDAAPDHASARVEVCQRLKLDPNEPLILVAGGGEGLGRIEETTARLLRLKEPQMVVLAGRNARLRARCERLARGRDAGRLRVLGWVGAEEMPQLMSAADLMVSKLGSMFHEAIAAGLPIVALEPPPGAERVQYRLLGEWGIGCAVRTLDEAGATVARLLADARELSALRERVRARRRPDAARRIALWLKSALEDESPRAASRRTA